MNENHKAQLSSLASLAKLYIHQEFDLNEKIIADPLNFEYLKQYALHQQQQQSTSSAKQKNSSPSPQQTPPLQPSNLAGSPKTQTPQTPLIPSKTLPIKKISESSASTEPSPNIAAAGTNAPPAFSKVPEESTKIEKGSAAKKSEPQVFFKLNPMEAPVSDELKDIRDVLKTQFPGLTIIDQVPDDTLARQMAKEWEIQQASPVLILIYNELEKHREFLNNVKKAIQLHLAPTAFIAAEKISDDQEWEKLLKSSTVKLIIANDSCINAFPFLTKNYKEDSRQGKHFIDKIPLLLLPDISLYLKEPKLKSSLWQAICERLPKRLS